MMIEYPLSQGGDYVTVLSDDCVEWWCLCTGTPCWLMMIVYSMSDDGDCVRCLA